MNLKRQLKLQIKEKQLQTKLMKNNTKARPRWKCKPVSIFFLCTLSIAVSASDLFWDKQPLALDLVVGKERLVHFPFPVSAGIPSNLRPMVRVESIGNTVYLTALEEFDAQRVLFKSKRDGAVMAFDIAASKRSIDLSALHIRTSRNAQVQDKDRSRLNYATLTRFAAQYAYAPDRLVEVPKGLIKTQTPKTADGLVRGTDILATPYASWKTATGLHLTIVRLSNKTLRPVELHPKQLRGKWATATFHHYRLLPKNSGADQTVVYLISHHEFARALKD